MTVLMLFWVGILVLLAVSTVVVIKWLNRRTRERETIGGPIGAARKEGSDARTTVDVDRDRRAG